jgi:hypothetical protein
MPGKPGKTTAKRTSAGKPKFDIHGNAGNPHGAGGGKPNPIASNKNTRAK